MASTSIDLIDDDWVEIYYALMDKAKRIREGGMGPQMKRGDNKRWAEHLEEIAARISNEVTV